MVSDMNNQELMVTTIRSALLNPSFLETAGFDEDVMTRRTSDENFVEMVYELAYHSGKHGRYHSRTILDISSRYTPELVDVPIEGWLEHTRL